MDDVVVKIDFVECPHCGTFFKLKDGHCCKGLLEYIEKSPGYFYSSSAIEQKDYRKPNYPKSEPAPLEQATLFTIPSNKFDYPTADFTSKQKYIKHYVNGDWDSPYCCKKVLNGMRYDETVGQTFIRREKMHMIAEFYNSIPNIGNIVIEFELSSAEETVLTALMEQYHKPRDYINERYKILTMKARKHITCKNCEYFDGYDCERLGLQLVDSDNYCSWAKERL